MSDEGDSDIRVACKARRYDLATRLTFERHGGDVLAFLCARLRSTSDGEEVFATFAEKFWVGLPGFEWRCSLRSWCYRLARNAANDFSALARNRPQRNLPLDTGAALSQLVDRVRTQTLAYLRTEMKDRMRELRETLPADDQMLLILRVDRAMSWQELASALHEGPDAPSDAELTREAARLRKRFERVKSRLKELARAEGLL